MKAKSIFAASLLVTGVAFADSTEVTTSYTLGVMPVSVTNETIIAIPWVEAGGDGVHVAVTNLVKTATLEAETTKLYWYDPSGGAYYGWKVVAGAGDVKYWQELSTATYDVSVAVGANKDVLQRGQAAILKRADNCTVTNIYLVGQYADSVVTTTITGPSLCTATNPTVALVAPPVRTTGAADLNTVASWTGVGPDDVIIFDTIEGEGVKVYKRYVWENSKWGTVSYKTRSRVFTPSAEISGGTGFWYLRAKEGDVTISWN